VHVGVTSKSKKKKNKKKGGSTNKTEEPDKVNGDHAKQDAEDHEDEVEDDDEQTVRWSLNEFRCTKKLTKWHTEGGRTIYRPRSRRCR
jgi:hypothetical protein